MEHDVEPFNGRFSQSSPKRAMRTPKRSIIVRWSFKHLLLRALSLININKKLDQYDAAMGVLRVVDNLQKKHPELSEAYKVQEAWLAKLGHWDAALVKYEQRLEENSADGPAIAGKLKCLDALGSLGRSYQDVFLSTLDQLRMSDSMNNNLS